MQEIKTKSSAQQTGRPVIDNRGKEGDVSGCHALPEEAQVLVQIAHVIGASWLSEASLGVFISLVYPIQGKVVEQRNVLVILAYLDEFSFPILVRLLEDRKDRPPSNSVQAHPKAVSRVLCLEQEEEHIYRGR